MRPPLLLIAATVLLCGCGSSATETNGNSDLDVLRRVTEPFQSFQTASTAGWSAKITPCMAGDAGGMGFHYGNPALIDGTLRVDEPELLLYEPDQNQTMHLVAVEYVVPFTAHPRDAAPPELYGQKFTPSDLFELWGLHVWLWKANAAGLYASWNPSVSCQYTTDIFTMPGH